MAEEEAEKKTATEEAEQKTSAEQKAAADKKTADAAAAKLADAANKTNVQLTEVQLSSTGNNKLDGIGKVLADKGVKNTNAILKEFSDTGTISLAAQAELVETLGDSIAGLVISQFTDLATNATNKATELKSGVLKYANEKFSGEDAAQTWKEIQEFASSDESGFNTADRQALNDLLAKGGFSAELAINKIFETYQNSGSTSTQADLLQGNKLATYASDPLSKADYAEQVKEAAQKYGYDSKQVSDLQNKRLASARRGY